MYLLEYITSVLGAASDSLTFNNQLSLPVANIQTYMDSAPLCSQQLIHLALLIVEVYPLI